MKKRQNDCDESDQGRDESNVSLLEMATRCGFTSSHWPTFPCSIGLKERPERLLLISRGGEQYAQEIEIAKTEMDH
ncbi:MAG: hypothetical protein M1511_06620 [Deltaproteobacteria bacterium]|nr:hypothetical protein [Deltaproteobacteria bacterium]